MTAEKIKAMVETLSGRQRDIAEHLLTFFEKAANPGDLLPNMGELFEMFDWKDGKGVQEVFKPGDDVYQVVDALVGGTGAATARRMWERATLFPCGIMSGQSGKFVPGLSVDMNTARGELLESRYIVKNIVVLLNYVAALMNGFSIWDYLDARVKLIQELGVANPLSAFGGAYGNPDDDFHAFRKRVTEAEAALPTWPGMEYFLPPLLGQMIDNDDVQARDFVFVVQKVLAGEGGRGSICAPILGGYLQGIREEVSSLDPFPLWLFAYPNQIIDNYNNPVKANFLWVMHNSPSHMFALLCKMAFDTTIPGPGFLEQVFAWWTGIEFDTSAYGVGRRDDILSITMQCLSSAQYREESLRGNDALRIYLSLWALACINSALALEAVVPILEAGTLEQIIPVSCFVEKLSSDAAFTKVVELLKKRSEFSENNLLREFLNHDPATRKTLRLVVYPAMKENQKPYLMPIVYEDDLPASSYPTKRSTVSPYLNACWVEKIRE